MEAPRFVFFVIGVDLKEKFVEKFWFLSPVDAAKKFTELECKFKELGYEETQYDVMIREEFFRSFLRFDESYLQRCIDEDDTSIIQPDLLSLVRSLEKEGDLSWRNKTIMQRKSLTYDDVIRIMKKRGQLDESDLQEPYES